MIEVERKSCLDIVIEINENLKELARRGVYVKNSPGSNFILTGIRPVKKRFIGLVEYEKDAQRAILGNEIVKEVGINDYQE